MPISLAEVFDALVEDETVTNQYTQFVLDNVHNGSCLDLACGTGTISEKLKAYFDVTGLDLDPEMLKVYSRRNPDCQTILGSMSDLKALGYFDAILLFGDSLNYVLGLDELKRVLSEAVSHLKDQAVFLFDMHTENRYEEFKEEYLEEGIVSDHPFQWTILSMPDQIINHHFAFYDELGYAQTISFDQRVYPLEIILDHLESLNTIVEVYSDFIKGIHPDKEKYLFVVKRRSL
ncbi:MAG: class I SAM-dependent methyltransferase [Erysipelotrichaceae bacterium]|nr:class I SAM-dependent methyltransferase [Erysipelotrichaceae bacterium]